MLIILVVTTVVFSVLMIALVIHGYQLKEQAHKIRQEIAQVDPDGWKFVPGYIDNPKDVLQGELPSKPMTIEEAKQIVKKYKDSKGLKGFFFKTHVGFHPETDIPPEKELTIRHEMTFVTSTLVKRSIFQFFQHYRAYVLEPAPAKEVTKEILQNELKSTSNALTKELHQTALKTFETTTTELKKAQENQDAKLLQSLEKPLENLENGLETKTRELANAQKHELQDVEDKLGSQLKGLEDRMSRQKCRCVVS
jgi:hypothetical protein